MKGIKKHLVIALISNPIKVFLSDHECNLLSIKECRHQNIAREYCKIFAAECRVIGTFGEALE
jgi:hypothetical protein